MIFTRENGGAAALAWAETQAGVPYLWGGEAPGVGFDCDGLYRWSYLQVGVTLTGNTYVNYTTAQIPLGSPYAPGDGLFFRGSDPGPNGEPGHVGLYVGVGEIMPGQHAWTAKADGQHIFFNAPYTGDPFGLRYDYFDPATVVSHCRPANLLPAGAPVPPSPPMGADVDDLFITANPVGNKKGDFFCSWSTRTAVGIPSEAIEQKLEALGAKRSDLDAATFAYFKTSNWKA